MTDSELMASGLIMLVVLLIPFWRRVWRWLYDILSGYGKKR